MLAGTGLGVAAKLDAAHAVIAILPVAMPNVCVLVAPDGRAFSVAADPDGFMAVSAFLVRSGARDAVRLQYPWGRSFLVVDGAALRFDGDGETPEAAFVLRALTPEAVPAAARALGAEVGRAASGRLRACPLLDAVRGGACRPELAASLIRVMARDERAALGRRLLDNTADRALLRRVLPGDGWVETHLPVLVAWQKTRAAAGGAGVVVSPAADEPALQQGPFTPNLVGTGLALQSLARRAVLPRRGACLLACARNEGTYLLDWLSYHLSIGFEHIFLYTNDNQDGSDALLGLLAGQGIITWIRNECGQEMSPQFKCYAHALRMLPQILDYAWAAVLDLDEYVGFDTARYSNVADFLAQMEVQSTDAVALCWLLHAARPDDRWSSESSLKRFPMRDPTVNQHIKSVIRPGLFWFSLPHDPVPTLGAAFEFRSPDGGLHHHAAVAGRGAALSGAPNAERAWISHYMLRSAEEALWKWARGQGDLAANNPVSRRSLEFIAGSFLNLARPEHLVEDLRIQACAQGQPAVLDRLLRLPGVADCDAEIKARFGARLAANTRAFLETPLPEGASGQVSAFRTLVESMS
jgi:hypothetical protein